MTAIKLHVTVEKATMLYGRNPNPYVVIHLKDDEPIDFKKTSTKVATINPEWNESFDFIIDDIKQESLYINIFNNSEHYPLCDPIIIGCKHFKPRDIPVVVEQRLKRYTSNNSKKEAGTLILSIESSVTDIPVKPKVKKSDARRSDARKSNARRSNARKSNAHENLKRGRVSEARRDDMNIKKSSSNFDHLEIKPERRKSTSAKKELVSLTQPEYTVTYRINIEIISGSNLLPGNKKSKCSPYCVFQVEGGTQKLMSKSIENNLNPTWNEVLPSLDGYYVSSDLLHVWVFDKDKKLDLKKNDCIGIYNIMVNDISALGVTQTVDIPLFKAVNDNKTGNIIQMRRSYPGDAGHLKINFHIAKLDQKPFVDNPWKAKFLEVYLEMNEAKNCPVMDGVKSSDPYVCLHISPAANKQRYKTIVQKQTLNPIWNEQIKFSIDDPKTQLIHFKMLHENMKMGKTKISFKGLKIGEIDELETQLKCNVFRQKGGILRYRITLVRKNEKPFVLRDPLKKVKQEAPAHCGWIWNSFGSSFSCSFDGYTENSSTLSDFHSWELQWHVHEDLPSDGVIKLTRGIIKGTLTKCNNLIKAFDGRTSTYVQLYNVKKYGKIVGDIFLTDAVENNENPVFNKKFEFSRIKKGDTLQIIVFQKVGPIAYQIGAASIPIRTLKVGEQELEVQLEKPRSIVVPMNVNDFANYGHCNLSLTYDLNE
ncbi:hypothetical protein TRFO_03214 [Tritrichomonas foetus]|uniref:C2 domain-containing protein n=1 Tax=Tritrichomonas foetus TaxID=1144522 RepID=A0A1J4KS99_9EUKA|nr:hypothetical protein TRFO_03214 [Tritrichomonas foetus]|eukprot:OHT14159.1 hypothetical protein TRFO_03214 [Tritrichomonas foetus]